METGRATLVMQLLVMLLILNDQAHSLQVSDLTSWTVQRDITEEGQGALRSPCSSDASCALGLYCFACPAAGVSEFQLKCTRKIATATSTFSKNTSLPFNKYAWLTTHNSYAIWRSAPQVGVPILTFVNQEDSVLEQLNFIGLGFTYRPYAIEGVSPNVGDYRQNGVRGLMLDMYNFRNNIWLCHSFQGTCYDFTAFRPAIQTLTEIKTFMDANPAEVITIFIEDYVHTQNGIPKLFANAGLMKYWMPVAMMPSNGNSWLTLGQMIERNHWLLVFTQNSTKESTEGIAYQWQYTTENQYGDEGICNGSCPKRNGSPPMSDTSRSLIVQNYFPTNPNLIIACQDNSVGLFTMLNTCFIASGKRWSNYIAVDFYKRSIGNGAFHALDFLNGQMQCNCQDVTYNCLC